MIKGERFLRPAPVTDAIFFTTVSVEFGKPGLARICPAELTNVYPLHGVNRKRCPEPVHISRLLFVYVFQGRPSPFFLEQMQFLYIEYCDQVF